MNLLFREEDDGGGERGDEGGNKDERLNGLFEANDGDGGGMSGDDGDEGPGEGDLRNGLVLVAAVYLVFWVGEGGVNDANALEELLPMTALDVNDGGD